MSENFTMWTQTYRETSKQQERTHVSKQYKLISLFSIYYIEPEGFLPYTSISHSEVKA